MKETDVAVLGAHDKTLSTASLAIGVAAASATVAILTCFSKFAN